jgi:hypothetical protein
MYAFDKLPCWTCEKPVAADVRCYLGQCDEEIPEAQRSPYSGLPIGCCRIRTAPITGHVGQLVRS